MRKLKEIITALVLTFFKQIGMHEFLNIYFIEYEYLSQPIFTTVEHTQLPI